MTDDWMLRWATLTHKPLLLAAVGATVACTPSPAIPADDSLPSIVGASEPESIDLGRWQPTIRSPRRPSTVVEPELARRCGTPDEALQKAAQNLALRGAERAPILDMPRLEFELRVAGAPYVWPHLWTVAGRKLDSDDVVRRFVRWLGTFSDGGERRCGLATVRDAAGREQIIAVVVDALVDLEPLPSTASVGQWLEIEARLLAPAGQASVVLLGPRGRPRTVPSSLSGNIIKSSFAPSEPGRWLVQIVALSQEGPRPMACAIVHVDSPPPQTYVSLPVPGETSALATDSPDRALARMLNAARASEGLAQLPRVVELDRVAQAHAESMAAAARLGHDVGEGTVGTRLARAGVVVSTAGENVARAGNVQRAHRVLWESPSHRETLLYDRYDAVGVGVARDSTGVVWVCEVFARL